MIPFLRIAHCPRGSYFKVLGDLILITADVSKSLERILPLEQSLIPVSFKRKLSYQGSYIEEFVEKEKVKLYFNWFKTNNHLYEDFQFNEELIEDFENESLKVSSEFQDTSNDVLDKSRNEDTSELLEMPNDLESIEIFRRQNIDAYQPVQNEGHQDQTSMFFNK